MVLSTAQDAQWKNIGTDKSWFVPLQHDNRTIKYVVGYTKVQMVRRKFESTCNICKIGILSGEFHQIEASFCRQSEPFAWNGIFLSFFPRIFGLRVEGAFSSSTLFKAFSCH